ncbi:hypothetical protein QLQ86_18185 [Halomonas sp. LR5S13]|uniref:hypothetical protein n=1 Tax=Halomonas rhizosphaerae TaxID=3043296 RepID=UPI0024A7C8F0|nr:hypothetical protein [Halomonas rhizosphaerae]MDI5922702.1 hypothetical protein [Halomonas rhizosphaerae]
MDYDFFLCRSPDFGVWSLLAKETESPTGRLDPADLSAWLADPPCKNLQAITDGLIELFLKYRQQRWVTEDDIRATLERLDFSIPTVQELLPVAPERWQPLPDRFHNHFGLSEGHGVNRELFLAWERHNAQEIIATLAEGRRDGILLIYELFAENVIPMDPYEVDCCYGEGRTRFPTTLGSAVYDILYIDQILKYLYCLYTQPRVAAVCDHLTPATATDERPLGR